MKLLIALRTFPFGNQDIFEVVSAVEPYHGIFSHKNDPRDLPLTSQALSYFVHLLTIKGLTSVDPAERPQHCSPANIVDSDNEDRLVFFEQAFQLVKVGCLAVGFAPHIFFGLKIGYFRAKLIYLRK